ncbi:MAG: fibronectin type III domain-containing protein, partial [Bacteroidales bacterium]|nr:fibronectin type III domain-containing protein [Bacteroidales bacterium]
MNTSRWLHLTHPDTLLDRTTPSTTYGTAAVPMGFLFRMMGEEIQSFSVHKSGRMYLNQSYNLNDFRTIHLNTPYTTNYLMPYGILRGWDSTATVVYQILGSPGNRVLVCEFAIKANSYSIDLSRFQIHLEEYSGTVRFVYGPRNDPSQGPEGEIGFARNYLQYNLIHPNLHRAAANTTFANMPDHLSWPGNNRYYEFCPQCLGMTHIVVDSIWRTSARAYWDGIHQHDHYLIEYGPEGFPDGERSFMQSTTDTVHLTGLSPSTIYEIRVRAVCNTGDTSDFISYTFCTTPYYPYCSNIPFTDFYYPGVTCKAGSFTTPDQYTIVVDFGSSSSNSRHTVHQDTNERDPRTNLQLRTIPPGHCSSVRLGNWMTGAQQESITYTLHVDTTDYDLLILRYAMVEQNPNHPAEEQPYFTLSIQDSTGRIIDNCHYANFVSGDASGWNGQGSSIVWHNWEAMGMNLAPFHGQTILVRLSNADCSMGGHYGYSYFTLEGATKHLNATSCGSSTTNTFFAPAGFNYRWYNTDNPSATLSTARSLHVTTEGTYECQVTYRLPGQNCGFTIRTRAGPRYPYAQFVMANLDSCGSQRRFINRSVVATDIDRTLLTTEPCEQFLWRFDDGTTDTNENPVHTFANGAHSATLIAMLANGLCSDSVTQCFYVDMPVDTQQFTVCPGQAVLYQDRRLTDSGTYVFLDGCSQHVVKVAHLPIVIPLVRDTICPRGAYTIGTVRYSTPGEYTIRTPWPDQNGCDSTIHLSLS